MRFAALGMTWTAALCGLGSACASDAADARQPAGAAGMFLNPIAGSFGNPGGASGAGFSGGVAAGTTGAPGGCGGDLYAAENKPLDIYVIMDESVSMLVPVDIWTPTSTALNQFFSSAETTGISAGIQFFSGGCDVAPYATPQVDMAELPGNAMALSTELAARVPGFGTATEPALRGAIQFAQTRATENPARKEVVLLVTDGEPASCDSTVESTSAAAAEGLAGTPSIPTYVLGLGNIGGLDQMAAAGGTGTAFVIDDPMQVQAIVDAMNAIRGLALPCEYKIPDATAGSFDRSLVNLNWTREGSTTVVPFVGGAEGCASAPTGWHYDNADAPTQLVACPQTCDALKSQGGDVSVVIGCPQITPE